MVSMSFTVGKRDLKAYEERKKGKKCPLPFRPESKQKLLLVFGSARWRLNLSALMSSFCK
jgi:hypothetical protein